MHHDQLWPRASNWLTPTAGELSVICAPLNRSVTPGRYDLGPDAIMKAMERLSTYAMTGDLELLNLSAIREEDIALLGADPMLHLEQIQYGVSRCKGSRVVILGGDNGVTRGGVRALAEREGVPLKSIGLITLDAHLDLRHLDDGPINGNPIRGLLQDGLPGKNIVQIGLQDFANSRAYAQVAVDHGIHTVSSEQAHAKGLVTCLTDAIHLLSGDCDVLYLDIDLDVMDRTFAPGCPGSRPGGFTPRDLRNAARLAGQNRQIAMIDIVELDPSLDINDTTAITAALCLLEFAAGMMSSG